MQYRRLTLALALLAGCNKNAAAQVGHTATAEDCREVSEASTRPQAEEGETSKKSENDTSEGWVTQARVDSIKRMNEGIRQVKRDNLSGAERAIAEAIEIDPSHAEAYLNLGKLYRKQQKWVDAETMFRGAIRNMADPRSDFYLELGAVLVAQSNEPGTGRTDQRIEWREAITSFSEALALDPNLFEAHYQIGTLHEKLDEPDQADSAYRKCIELDANYSPCFVSLGNMYIDYGFESAAMAVLETGSQVNPMDADMWNGIGRALLAPNRPREAIDAYTKARRIDPDKLDVLFGLGMAYAEIPMREEAEDTLGEFLSKAGNRVPQHIIMAAQDTVMRMMGPI